MKCSGNKNGNEPEVEFEKNPEGCYLELQPLGEKILNDIRMYWENESVKKGYYNISKDIKLIEILELNDLIPKSWVVGLDEK